MQTNTASITRKHNFIYQLKYNPGLETNKAAKSECNIAPSILSFL